jgi:hypothetical protein
VLTGGADGTGVGVGDGPRLGGAAGAEVCAGGVVGAGLRLEGRTDFDGPLVAVGEDGTCVRATEAGTGRTSR